MWIILAAAYCLNIINQPHQSRDCLVGIAISMSDCHPSGPGFDYRLNQEF